MKIGILAYRQFPFVSANTAIAYILGHELSVLGYTIVNIGYFQSSEQSTVSEYEGNKIFFLNSSLERNIRVKNLIFKAFGNRYRLLDKTKRLQQIVVNEKIDVLISVIAPSDDLLITHYSKLKIPVIVYQLDPFYNYIDHENSKSKMLFVKMISTAKHVFTTNLLYSEYQKDASFAELLNKISVVQFPKLINKPHTYKNKKHSEKVRLLYAGSLYYDIRNPRILALLRKMLPDNCEIVFCGGCDREEDNELLKRTGIICRGYCLQNVLNNEIEEADILINIGNKVKNQLGSKIVDYIATGKPILNIYQIDECPTLPLLERYPYKISINCKELENSFEILTQFYNNNIGNRAEWDQIQKLYQEYTPDYVAKEFLKIIREL